MGNSGASAMGMQEAPNTMEEVIPGIVEKASTFMLDILVFYLIDRLQIDAATRQKTSGTFQSFDATKFDW